MQNFSLFLVSFITILSLCTSDAAAQSKLELTAQAIFGGSFQDASSGSGIDVQDTFDHGPNLGAGLDVRFYRPSGHGVVFRGDWTSTLLDDGFGFATGTLAYSHRFVLGESPRGTKTNLDLLAGVRGGVSQVERGLCFLSCDTPSAVAPLEGGVLGPTTGVDIGWDIKRFTIGLGATYSPMFGLSSEQPNVHHSLEGRLKVGVNFDL